MQINLLSGSIFAILIIMAWQHKSVLDEPLQWFLVGFGGGAFGDACILKFAAGSSELRWDGQPAVAAVSCSSFGSERTNIIEKQIEKLLLGIRYHQKLLSFFVFHNSSRHSADDLVETKLREGFLVKVFSHRCKTGEMGADLTGESKLGICPEKFFEIQRIKCEDVEVVV